MVCDYTRSIAHVAKNTHSILAVGFQRFGWKVALRDRYAH